jgi:DNA-binding winged helix-turn-helix (wHTH) protein/TolB-like protein/Tfp pilus assembly protein PilF
VNGDFRFGSYELRRSDRLLLRDGQVVVLPPRAVDLLLFLIEAGGRLVTKEEILQNVWAGVFVEEANIAHQISTIRKALGDQADLIETVPRRGYRFTGPLQAAASAAVTVVEETRTIIPATEERPRSSNRRWWMIGVGAVLLLFLAAALLWTRRGEPSRNAIHSIAVLPFESLDGNPDDAYLKLGMADAVINRLSTIEALTVRPISAVRALPPGQKDIAILARLLKVEAILEGSVQRQGSRLRVTSRLVRASDGNAIWAGKFDEEVNGLFALQDELSEKVARSVAPAIRQEALDALQKRDTLDPEAYELYLRGRAQWGTFTASGRNSSLAFYQAAIDRDPQFALPWLGLADTYSLIGIYGPLPAEEAFTKAREAAGKADSIQPGSADVLATLAVIDLLYDRNWEEGRRHIDAALARKDDQLTAWAMRDYYFQSAGKAEEALAACRRQREIDPVWQIPQNDHLHALLLFRRFAEALQESEAILRVDPRRAFALNTRGIALAQMGRTAEALTSLRAATKLGSNWSGTEEAWILARQGDRQGALRVMENVQASAPEWRAGAFYYAMVYAALGDRDEAFRLLDVAAEERYAFVFRFRLMHEFDSLRPDPRFAALERKLDLPR